MPELDVVTGAFSFTGKYITRRLLAQGRQVRTLTGHPGREHSFGEAVAAFPFRFDDPAALGAALRGRGHPLQHLLDPLRARPDDLRPGSCRDRCAAAARPGGRGAAGGAFQCPARRSASPYPYFRAKGEAERLVRGCGLSHAILRPTVLFGEESIFINNVAWMLRKFPFFAIPGREGGRLQPVCVDDVAELAVEAARQSEEAISEAAGPEVFTFVELVRLIARETGSRVRLMHFRPERTLQFSRMIGGRVGDVVLTKDEIDGLLNDLLVAKGPATGHTRFSDWLSRRGKDLGRSYVSEMERHFR